MLFKIMHACCKHLLPVLIFSISFDTVGDFFKIFTDVNTYFLLNIKRGKTGLIIILRIFIQT